ncbi:hypothetical protein B0H14DRAFT_2871915 [Mycena olivaceomarginata]|nr:hypothetical protein B0H14DRAFT_2871915 [Mycena olivaceomarginata]
MADSLSPQCTPLKHEYDSCFNKQRTAHYQRKADEFQAKCGKVYAEYQNCIQVGRMPVKERGIEPLLQQAREEHPLREPLPPAAPPSKDSK